MTDAELKKFEAFKQNLLDWNQRINLTAITDDEGIRQKHFADSLTLLPLLPPIDPIRLIDIGAGAGFPGIPLKIMRPDIRLTLLEARQKKVGFLEDTAAKLGFENVECVHGRAEDFVKEEGRRGGYDIACARAVAPLDRLVRWCMPFVKRGGLFLAMKGPKPDAEVREAESVMRKMGAGVREIKYVEIAPGMVHSVVVVCYT